MKTTRYPTTAQALPHWIRLGLCAAFLLAIAAAAPAANVTVEAAIHHQTMDGFGGTEHWLFPPASEYSRIFDDLGVSVLRFRMLRYTESVPDVPGDEARDNDNDDPFVIDWSGVATSYFGAVAPMLQAAQSRGVKLFGNVMCPPPWMKTTGLADGPGSLKSGYEDELVEFILIWVEGMQIYHNVHIDYVNFENEPNYQRSYPSCYMSPSQLQILTKRLRARFAAEGITTKIVPPETSNLPTFLSWANTICQDVDAKAYIDRLSTHSYNIDFYTPDANNSNWVSAHDLATSYGKPLWLTEYCLDYGTTRGTWGESIALVQHIHNALAFGQVSAWLYHEIYRDPSGSPLALIDPAGAYPKFYAVKQYFRYVRPGAVRIEAACDDPDLLVTAFTRETDRTFTLVAINRGSATKTADCSLSGLGGRLTSLDEYRTSVTEDCELIGTVPASGNSLSVALPAQSSSGFTTLVGQWRVAGDADDDGDVDVFDVIAVVAAFGSQPGDANWAPGCDFNGNGSIDVLDVIATVTNFGAGT